jgi:hypothetical protein
MTKNQFVLRLRFTVTMSGFEPLEFRYEGPLAGSRKRLWSGINYWIGATERGFHDEFAYKKNEIILKEILLFDLKKTAQGRQKLQPVFYWLMGNEDMPVYDENKIKNYVKNFLAQQSSTK